MEIRKIYVRPNPRFPKIIALAVALDHLRQQGAAAPVVEMKQADQQQAGSGIYQLDCGPNEYRKRGMESELAVVVKDLGIAPDDVLVQLMEDLGSHNKGAGVSGGKSHFYMNHAWGSAGWFSGCAWPLIESVPASHWRWTTEAVEGAEGQIQLNDNGKPTFQKGAKAIALTEQGFLGMCIDVVATWLHARRTKKETRSWGEGEKLKVIRNMLEAKFTGSDLKDRAVKSGNFQFPTMSGYIRDLWMTGSGVDEIRTRLRPWLRLWEIAGDCYHDAESLKPLRTFKIGGGSYGVAFDLSKEKSAAADGNPLIHQRWLAKGNDKDSDNINLVIVRRETGHTAIISRPRHETRMKPLWAALNFVEPGRRWHLQGLGIYNGSYSRVEMKPSKIPLEAQGGNTLVNLVTHAIEKSYEFAQGEFNAQFGGWHSGMFEK